MTRACYSWVTASKRSCHFAKVLCLRYSQKDALLIIATVIFVFLLTMVGVGLVAVTADHRLLRDPLLIQTGTTPRQLASLFESAPLGLLLLDQQEQPVYANGYARRLLPGLQAGNEGAWRTELRQDLSAVRHQAPNQPRHRILTLPTDHSLSWWLCPFPRFTLLFLVDLSQQHRLQKASQTFLSTVSHELRTPLTAVLAHLDIVQKQDVDEATRQNSLNIIHQELNRLARLVQDMLQLGRLEMSEAVEKQPLDLFVVAESAVAEVILMAEAKNIAISLEATAPLPRVSGDADKLKQAFLNVLDNSIKYGHAGDQIKIRLKPETDGVQVVIQDTGPGIPQKHLPYVTERLYRAHKDSEGSGVGLAIVTEILRLHGARLDIESPYDEETGVRVSFLLPTNEPEPVDS